MTTIEKNIPIPEAIRGRPIGNTKYGIEKMEVGDSMLFEGYSSTTGARPYSSAISHGKTTGKKFAARAVDGGLRIWRIA